MNDWATEKCDTREIFIPALVWNGACLFNGKYLLIKQIVNFGNVSAQLWQFDNDGHLRNKLRTWSLRYSSSSISIPKNSSEGYIEIEEINKVFTLDNKTNVVNFDVKDANNIVNQKWTLGRKDKKGWMNIKHSSTGLYLTTGYTGYGTVITVEDLGKSKK